MDKRRIEIQYPMKPREEEPAHAPCIICREQDAPGDAARDEAL